MARSPEIHVRFSFRAVHIHTLSFVFRREAGGITQEIRARTVSLELNQKDKADSGDAMGIATPISSGSGLATVATFLDTPGQEIFYRMRTNGARVADAVLLVVSGVHGCSVCGAI